MVDSDRTAEQNSSAAALWFGRNTRSENLQWFHSKYGRLSQTKILYKMKAIHLFKRVNQDRYIIIGPCQTVLAIEHSLSVRGQITGLKNITKSV